MVLELFIVRVFKFGGGVVGLGFFVFNEYILICVYVVVYCLISFLENVKKIMR